MPHDEKTYYHGIGGRRLLEFKKTGLIPPARQAFGGEFSITDDFELAKMHAGKEGIVVKIKLNPEARIREVPTDDVFEGKALEHSGDILDTGEGEFLVVNPNVILHVEVT